MTQLVNGAVVFFIGVIIVRPVFADDLHGTSWSFTYTPTLTPSSTHRDMSYLILACNQAYERAQLIEQDILKHCLAAAHVNNDSVDECRTTYDAVIRKAKKTLADCLVNNKK